MSPTSIALNRFGLGARGDEPPPADPRRWLTAQLNRFDGRPPAIAATPTRRVMAEQLADYLETARPGMMANGEMPRPAMKQPEPKTITPGMTPGNQAMSEDDQFAGLPETARNYLRQQVRDNYVASIGARATAALVSPAPFVERMVHFWANHFAVSADKLPVIGMAGLLEFEAIRPHVLGRFSDMLNAVERHPAMLLFLDQAQSIGPNSPVGSRVAAWGKRKVGINENLAREIMELHTLGVGSGYGQADVTEFARALTGWTVAGLTRGPIARFAGIDGAPGDFVFAAALHEPGVRLINGRRYDRPGEQQAQAVLDDLAAHPATALHIATKLARHFAGDTPPPAMVARLQGAYLRSGGDLPTLYRAVFDSPEVWVGKPGRFRSPWDWTLAALRAVSVRDAPARQTAGLLTQLGQPVWRPGSPAGFDDLDARWAGADAVMRRVEAAERIAARAAGQVDVRALADRIHPGGVGPVTRSVLAEAESPAQALALLLVAPETLRR